MLGLLEQGNDVWLTKNDNPNRKLKYTLEIIKVNKSLIGVNTHRANKIVEHGLNNKLISDFKNIKTIKPEFKYSSDTRFDFLCDKNIIEVKNVTLRRENDTAEFPDSVTSRGSKHLIKLINSLKSGYKPFVLFLTQIQDIRNFRIAKDIDNEYYNNYLLAKKAGVKFLAYRCVLSSTEIKIEKKIKIIDER
jgi:sugar fermentation stimulation protein A